MTPVSFCKNPELVRRSILKEDKISKRKITLTQSKLEQLRTKLRVIFSSDDSVTNRK